MPVVGMATECVPESVIPWLASPDVLAPVNGRMTPLIADVGTNATPCEVNDGSCGVVTAAYETPAVVAKSAALATSIAGEGRRKSLRMEVPFHGGWLVYCLDASAPARIPRESSTPADEATATQTSRVPVSGMAR